MTLEIQHGKSLYQYRINEYNNREIDRRLNRRGARWERYSQHATPEAARETLLSLEAGRKRKEAGK